MCEQITELLTYKIKDTFHVGTNGSNAIIIFYVDSPSSNTVSLNRINPWMGVQNTNWRGMRYDIIILLPPCCCTLNRWLSRTHEDVFILCKSVKEASFYVKMPRKLGKYEVQVILHENLAIYNCIYTWLTLWWLLYRSMPLCASHYITLRFKNFPWFSCRSV
jgi:hypothetical protein